MRSSSPTRRQLARYGTTVASLPRVSSAAMGRPPDPYGARDITLYHRFGSTLLPRLERILRERLGVDKAYWCSAIAHAGWVETLAMHFDLVRPAREDDAAHPREEGRYTALGIDALIPKHLEGRERAEAIQGLFERLRSRVAPSTWLFGTTALAGQRVLMTRPGVDRDRLVKILRGSGLVPPMNEAAAALARLDFAGVLESHGIDLDLLIPAPEPTSSHPDAFFSTSEWRHFANAFEKPPSPGVHDARALLGHADYLLLRALKPLTWPRSEVPRRDIVGSLERLTELLAQFTGSDREDPRGYGLTHELIHEELRFILDVARPYERSDLGRLHRARAGDPGGATRGRREPRLFAFNSGVACVDAILRAVTQITPEHSPKIAVASPNYFETTQILELLRPVEAGSPRAVILDQASRALDDHGAFDLIFAISNPPFHQSLGHTYAPIDLEALLSLLRAGACTPGARRCVLAVDITLALPGSSARARLEESAATAVEAGTIDLVLFKSAQKYELLGVDRISAGIVEVYSRDDELGQALAALAGQIEDGDAQMLAHLQHARSMIDAYPRLHAANAQRLREALKEVSGSSALRIAPGSDAELTFVSLENHAEEATELHLSEHILALASSVGLTLVERDSFGFNHAALNVWRSTLRLSLGTEPTERVKAFGEQLVKLDHDLSALAPWLELQASVDGETPPRSPKAVTLALTPYYAGRSNALRWRTQGLPEDPNAQSWTWGTEQWEAWSLEQNEKQPLGRTPEIHRARMSHSVGLADGFLQSRAFSPAFARVAEALVAQARPSPDFVRRSEMEPVAYAVGRLADGALDSVADEGRAIWARVAEASRRLSSSSS